MKLVVIDGQSGRTGALLVERSVQRDFPWNCWR